MSILSQLQVPSSEQAFSKQYRVQASVKDFKIIFASEILVFSTAINYRSALLVAMPLSYHPRRIVPALVVAPNATPENPEAVRSAILPI